MNYDFKSFNQGRSDLIEYLARKYWDSVTTLQLPSEFLDRALSNFVTEKITIQGETDKRRIGDIHSAFYDAIVNWGASHNFVIEDANNKETTWK